MLWLRRHLIRRARARRRPRERIIVSTRPYDWQLDGFGDELYAPLTREQERADAQTRHHDTSACHRRLTGVYADDECHALIDYEQSQRTERGYSYDE